MIFVLTFLNFAFGTHSNGICLDSRHLVLGLRVQSTSVNGSSDKSFLSNLSIRSLAFLVNFLAVAKCICAIKALKWTLIYWTLFGQSVDHITWLLIRWQLYQNSFRD